MPYWLYTLPRMLNWGPIESIYIFTEIKHTSSSRRLLFTPAVSFNKGNQYVSPHHSVLWRKKKTEFHTHWRSLPTPKSLTSNSETAVLSLKEPQINCSPWRMRCTYMRHVLHHVASRVLRCDTVTLVAAATSPTAKPFLHESSLT